jgi:hypothetical protein
MLACYFNFSFSDFNLVVESKYELGWLSIGLFGFNFIVNLSIYLGVFLYTRGL